MTLKKIKEKKKIIKKAQKGPKIEQNQPFLPSFSTN
jgi:hypothetical protein